MPRKKRRKRTNPPARKQTSKTEAEFSGVQTLQPDPSIVSRRTRENPSGLTSSDIVQLQRSFGNQQVQRLLQRSEPVQRQDDAQAQDPAEVLSPSGLSEWETLDGDLRAFRFNLFQAQQVNWNMDRDRWYQEARQLNRRLDRVKSDEEIPAIESAYQALLNQSSDFSIPAGTDWGEVQSEAVDEISRLAEGGSMADVYAYDYLFYAARKTTRRVSRIDPGLLVESDYRDLKHILADQEHIWKGEIKAARERAKALFSLLDIVGQLRSAGEDVEEAIPGWSEKVAEERRRLLVLAASAPSYEHKFHFMHLDEGLKIKYDLAMEKRKAEKGVAGKGVDLIKGAVSAVTDPLIEAGKQAIDISKIALFALDEMTIDTDWEPELSSDMSKAAAQGAGTGDLIVAMGKNIIETPERMWTAIKNDDWEAIGREAVNLYMLAKSGKQGLAKANSLMKLVKARRLGLRKGMSVDVALKVREIAVREGLSIRFRMVDKPVIRLLKKGHPAKPAMLKMKTISELDTHLGASKRDIGKVGFYEPQLPSKLLRMSEKKAAAVMERYHQRMAEYTKYKAEVQSMVESGVIEQQGKVIVDPVTRKAFTGDYDLFDIRQGGNRGPGVELEALKKEIRQALEDKPVDVQHGAHLDWKEFKAGEVDAFAKIVKGARPKEGNPPLVEIGPDGKVRYTHFDD